MSEPDIDALRAARDELDAVITEIRQLEGFEDFLAAPDFTQIVAAARHRPIAYVAAAEAGGLALLVRDDVVTDLDLPVLTAGEVRMRVDEYVRRHERFRREVDPTTSEVAWRQWVTHADETTAWLWDAVMCQLIDELDPPPTGSFEVALVPCGLLGLLPMHAAWTEDAGRPTGRRYALDSVVWTYTPNARALSACWAAARATSLRSSLVVGDPTPRQFDLPALPAIRAMSNVVKAWLPGGPEPLMGEAATRAGALAALAEADVVHLGCHGVADLTDPLRGRIVLGDGDLAVEELLRLRLRARLAVVAACETAMVGTVLPDEVVSLPTGLVQAGAAAVVASMWGCDQLTTALILVEFYRRLPEMSPATALRDAQCCIRDSTRDELRQRWEAALDEAAAWLPESAGEPLLNLLLVDPPGEREPRPWSGIETWAALSYTGA